MPPLIALAVIGVGAYAGYRLFKTVSEELEKAAVEVRERVKPREPRDLGALEYDPISGEYRPRR